MSDGATTVQPTPPTITDCRSDPRIGQTTELPIIFKLSKRTPKGEYHYEMVRKGGPDQTRYDVYIKVEGRRTTWRLEERYQKETKRFSGLKPCVPQTIEPNLVLLRDSMGEGHALVVTMIREGVRLVVMKGPSKADGEVKGCPLSQPAPLPTFLGLYFENPVCEFRNSVDPSADY